MGLGEEEGKMISIEVTSGEESDLQNLARTKEIKALSGR